VKGSNAAHDDGGPPWDPSDEPRPDNTTRDSDGDGTAETKSVLPPGLHYPFGMALMGSDLYVADTDAVMRFGHTEGATEIKSFGTKVADLPGGPLNHHWTKNIIA